MTEFLLAAAEQPWIYAAVVLACLIDGFFPPIPSEALLVAMAALAATHGGHGLWMLLLAGVLGAFLGDNVAYVLGRCIGRTRFKWMRRPLMQRSFARAARGLESRAVSMLLVARFLPGARVAVNLTAGATGFPRKKFVAISALSASLWGAYSVGIGTLAGAWLGENPLLGLVVAVVVAGAIGGIVDVVARKLSSRSRRVLKTRRVDVVEGEIESARETVGATTL
ncbi:DedA family protein [Arthrobacter sp. TWP1-1]|uniref:DedA family protein n=1 Tax=Arthrobacter sp. TWP1-1 TaxID=2804568 RepID=UPI003CF579B4